MGAAIDDVHHRNGKLHRARAAKVAVQRQAGFFCSSARHSHGDSQGGVGAKAGFVMGAIKLIDGAIQECLLTGIETHHRFSNFGIDILNGLENAFA